MSPGWVLASIAGLLVGALGIVILRHNLRLRALRRRVAGLSDEDYDGLLEAIDTFTPERATACLLVDAARERRTKDSEQLSRIGGAPPVGVESPLPADAGGACFLMQIHVPRWLESSPWRGDLIVFFFSRKPYAFAGVRRPATHRGIDAPDSVLAGALPIRWLRTVRVPRVPHGATKFRNLFAPRMLLQHVPGLSERVASHSSDAQRFLTAVLAPTSWCEELDMFERIQVGGSPQWVQSPATPHCEVCGRSLKFIAQVGCDASNAFRGTGFIGVFYAFGCETHPDRIACVAQYT